MPDRTPGQAAYEKLRELNQLGAQSCTSLWFPEWGEFTSEEKAIWEAVAEAASDQTYQVGLDALRGLK